LSERVAVGDDVGSETVDAWQLAARWRSIVCNCGPGID
jgi:hypothetical protein